MRLYERELHTASGQSYAVWLCRPCSEEVNGTRVQVRDRAGNVFAFSDFPTLEEAVPVAVRSAIGGRVRTEVVPIVPAEADTFPSSLHSEVGPDVTPQPGPHEGRAA